MLEDIVGPDTPWRTRKSIELVAEGFRVRMTNCTNEAKRIYKVETIAAVFIFESYIRSGGDLVN